MLSLTLKKRSFDSIEQIRQFMDALRARALPLKFAYVGSAAHTHDKLVRSKSYGMADTETRLLRTKFPALCRSLLLRNGLSVIDIGSGNGMKAIVLLKCLQQICPRVDYVALDYSLELLNIAKSNITKELPSQRVTILKTDFEESDFRVLRDNVFLEKGCRALFLFLGHTFGNPFDRNRTLDNIQTSMRVADNLLLGIEFFEPNRVSQILAHYENRVFHRAVFKPLSFAGIPLSAGTLVISFEEETRNVEAHFKLLEDIRVVTDSCEEVILRRGERILMFISHRFDQQELLDLLLEKHLQVINLVKNEPGTYGLLLLSKITNPVSRRTVNMF